jgi:hypothetical protein
MDGNLRSLNELILGRSLKKCGRIVEEVFSIYEDFTFYYYYLFWKIPNVSEEESSQFVCV